MRMMLSEETTRIHPLVSAINFKRLAATPANARFLNSTASRTLNIIYHHPFSPTPPLYELSLSRLPFISFDFTFRRIFENLQMRREPFLISRTAIFYGKQYFRYRDEISLLLSSANNNKKRRNVKLLSWWRRMKIRKWEDENYLLKEDESFSRMNLQKGVLMLQ